MSAPGPDWLGAARAAADELEPSSPRPRRPPSAPARPARAARAATARWRSTRRPRPRCSASSSGFIARAPASPRSARSAARVDFGGGDVRVVIDPIDGSKNAKRGLPHYALSIAVADGPTMADVVFGYVHDFGPREEWVARRGEGALLNGEPLDPEVPERRVARQARDPRRRVRRSALGARSPPTTLAEVAHRVRALGTIAVSLCQVAAARLDGMVTLRGCRAVDVAAAQLIVREAGGLVAFTAFADAARRPARLCAALADRGAVAAAARERARRRAARTGPRRAAARRLPSWGDGRLAAGGEGGGGRCGAPTGGGSGAVPAVVGPADESERLVAAYTGLRRSPAAAGRRGDRPPRVDRREPRLDARRARARRGARRPEGRLAGRRRRRRGGRRARHGGRRDLRLPGRPRAGPVRVPGARARRARAAAVRRAQPRPRGHARSTRTPTSCCAGSPCTRPRTRCSSAACRGCGRTSPGWCGSSPRRSTSTRAGCSGRARRAGRPARARRHGPGGRRRRRRARARAARADRPCAGLHGGARGLRRARHGRRRRRRDRGPAAPARRRWSAAGTTAPGCCGCSSG